jgi:hypothetical protein
MGDSATTARERVRALNDRLRQHGIGGKLLITPAVARGLKDYYHSGVSDLLEAYSRTVLRRVWREQHFSW